MKRILLADDEPKYLDMMRRSFAGKDYLLMEARDGQTALEMAQNGRPDVIVLDMMMPELSGFQVLDRLRRELTDDVPIIMITGSELSRHENYARVMGADAYLRKPFPMEELVAQVESFLHSEPMRQAS